MSLRGIEWPTEITALWSDLPPIEDWTDKLPRQGTWENYSKSKIVRGKHYYTDGSVLDYYDSKKSYMRVPAGLRPFAFDEIDTIVIHHTASDAPLANQASYHVNSHKWPGIAYHLVIDQNRLKQCNDLFSMTFHASSWNTNTVAVCINANLSKRSLTEQERKLLYAAILTVKALIPTIKYIKGHNEVPNNATACPCISMELVRSDIEKIEAQMQSKQIVKESDTAAIAYRCANQTMYLYNMVQGKLPDGKLATPGQIEWAKGMLLKLEPFMRENGLFG